MSLAEVTDDTDGLRPGAHLICVILGPGFFMLMWAFATG
jgi:hypothetical protein